MLSVGEQQRIAFARVLLAKVKFVLLDESTSALDIPTERAVCQLLQDAGAGYVSVGHRSSLLPFNDSVVALGLIVTAAGACVLSMTRPSRGLDGLPQGVLAFRDCWDAS